MKVSAETILSPISHFLKRFHVILFTTTVVVGTAVAVWFLLGAVNTSSKPSGNAVAPPTGFDKETIEKLDQLTNQPDPNGPLNIPDGRINPLSQ